MVVFTSGKNQEANQKVADQELCFASKTLAQTIGQTELKTTALPDEVIIRFPGWDNKPQLWMTIDNKIWGQLHDQEAPVRLEIEVSYSAII